jgi:serine/threonine-protein kinase RsbW
MSRLPNGEFFGRQLELERLCTFATEGPPASNLLVLGPPRSGKTELLREAFDRLFNQGGQCIPIYYALSTAKLQPAEFATDYLTRFLSQFIAFRRADPEILRSTSDSLSVVSRKAPAQDYSWIHELVELASDADASRNGMSMLKLALSAPAIACLNSGVPVFMMLDDFQRLAALFGSGHGDALSVRSELVSQLLSGGLIGGGYSADSTGAPRYALCGQRRSVLEMLPPEQEVFERLQILGVAPLAEGLLEQMIAAMALRLGVTISDSTIELMIQQLGCDLFYIRSLLSTASSRGVSLKSFMEFERLYTEELIDGRVGLYFDALIRDVSPDVQDRRAVLEILGLVTAAESTIPAGTELEKVQVGSQTLDGLLAKLHVRELIETNVGNVRRAEDPVLADYVRSRYRDQVAGWPRPIAGYQLLGEKLKTSYRLMMSRYNRAVASQLVQMLLGFDFQAVPASLFGHSLFESLYSGISRVQARRALDDEKDRIRLPQMVFVTDLGTGEKPGLGWHFFGASGFEGGVYSDATEIFWIIALINSTEPLNLDTLEMIDNRMRSAAQNWRREQDPSGAAGGAGATPDAHRPDGRLVRWFISKEGFSTGAAGHLARTGAYTSNYSHLDLIFDNLLKLTRGDEQAHHGSDFELVIPIEDEAELIAARTVEQIARAADFDQESINQLKTALVEACLNAAEHADSPDRRIQMRFTVTDDRLIITVSNKGARFDESVYQTAGLPGSVGRGRGLQIIRALMDEVRFERTDDGASLVMTKLMKQPES